MNRGFDTWGKDKKRFQACIYMRFIMRNKK